MSRWQVAGVLVLLFVQVQPSGAPSGVLGELILWPHPLTQPPGAVAIGLRPRGVGGFEGPSEGCGVGLPA